MLDKSPIISPYQCLLVKSWNRFFRAVPASMKSSTLSSKKLIEAAINKAGSSDFGDTQLHDALEQLVSDINRSSGIHDFGNFYLKQLFSTLLLNRLELMKFWNAHSEVQSQHIEKPLIILGLPRTGTSFLFNLLAQDSSHRYLTNWEAIVSQVPPEKGCTTPEKDPRRKTGKVLMRFQDFLVPHMKDIHTFYLDGPEECTPFLMQGFTTLALAGNFDVPEYSEWLKTADHDPTYRHHHRILQTLQWSYPGGSWLLKSPSHVEAIDSLLKVYPDACFIQLHRDPVDAITSFASLCAAFRGVYVKSLDMHKIGEQALETMAFGFDKYLEHRQTINPDRFIDLQYRDLVDNPLSTVESIYQRFNKPYSQETARALSTYLELDNSKDKGAHTYECYDFGLTPEKIRARLKDYIEFESSSSMGI